MENTKNKLGMSRRGMMFGSAAAIAGGSLASSFLAAPALANSKPAKLTVLGDAAPWKGTIIDDAIPAFTAETGIAVEYVQLPNEPLVTRARAELTSGAETSFDVMQMGASMIGWMHPYMEDINELAKSAGGKYAADFDMADISKAALDLASIDGVQRGIPFRSTTYILHYQPALLAEVGYNKAPENFAELLDAAQKLTAAGGGNRFGIGYCGRQGGAIVDHFGPYLRSAGGDYYNSDTREIYINNEASVGGVDYFASLLNKHKVVPQDALTWEWDEIIANAQNDRYAMAVTLNASATPINRSDASKTKGKWAWAVVPGLNGVADSRSSLGGWSFAVPKAGPNKEYAFEFVQWITSKHWSKRSMEKGNASPRMSVLNDPEVISTYGFTGVMAEQLKTAVANPRDSYWGAVEAQLRAGLSKTLLGEASAKAAMDEVAEGWARTMRRAG